LVSEKLLFNFDLFCIRMLSCGSFPGAFAKQIRKQRRAGWAHIGLNTCLKQHGQFMKDSPRSRIGDVHESLESVWIDHDTVFMQADRRKCGTDLVGVWEKCAGCERGRFTTAFAKHFSFAIGSLKLCAATFASHWFLFDEMDEQVFYCSIF